MKQTVVVVLLLRVEVVPVLLRIEKDLALVVYFVTSSAFQELVYVLLVDVQAQDQLVLVHDRLVGLVH